MCVLQSFYLLLQFLGLLLRVRVLGTRFFELPVQPPVEDCHPEKAYCGCRQRRHEGYS